MKDGIDLSKFADNGKDPFADELPKNQYVKISEDNEVGTCTICRVDAITGKVKSEQIFAIPKSYDAYRSMCEVGAAHELYDWQSDALAEMRRICPMLGVPYDVRERLELLIERGEEIQKKARGEE